MATPEVIAQRTVSSTREFSNICLFNYIGNVKLYEIVFRNNNFTFVVFLCIIFYEQGHSSLFFLVVKPLINRWRR